MMRRKATAAIGLVGREGKPAGSRKHLHLRGHGRGRGHGFSWPKVHISEVW